MLRKSIAVVMCGVAAAALVAGAVPGAAADRQSRSGVVLRDGGGDVWRVNLRTSRWTPAGDLPAADVRLAVVRHRARSVVIRARFDDLRRVGIQNYWAGLTTPSGDFFAEVISRPRSRTGRHALYDGVAGKRIQCAGVSHRIDYVTDTVTVRVSRTCLGHPRWVTVNTGNILVLGDRQYRRHFADNPHNRQAYANVGTRRIFRR